MPGKFNTGSDYSSDTSSGNTNDTNYSTNSFGDYFVMDNVVTSDVNVLSTTSIGDYALTSVLNPTSSSELLQYTSLDGSEVFSISNRDYYVDDCTVPENTVKRYTFATEKHITVIRKGPTMPLQLELYPYEDGTIGDRADVSESNLNDFQYFNDSSGYSGQPGDYNTDDAVINTSFSGDRMHQSSNYGQMFLQTNPQTWYYNSPTNPHDFLVGDYWGQKSTTALTTSWNTFGTGNDKQDISMFYKPNKEVVKPGDIVNVPIDVTDTGQDWEVNDHIIVTHEFLNSFGDTLKATARLQIVNISKTPLDLRPPGTMGLGQLYFGYGWYPCSDFTDITWASPLGDNNMFVWCNQNYVETKVVSITNNFPIKAITPNDLYNVYLVQKPPIFKLKFPKFGYRYKYEDGEYSVFSPWSEIAFVPGTFDYLPKKGFNLGMENNLRRLNLLNWVPKNIPKDVEQVDILYKESNSPNVYTICSHKKDDEPEVGSGVNYWNTPANGGHSGVYKVKSELIHKVVQSNQLLRPWDNVPRKARAQEVTANRLVFANYVQNFNVTNSDFNEIIPVFSPTLNSSDFSLNGDKPLPGYPGKSLKSMRTYQLGVVYRGAYGRETPVLTSKSGSIKVPKSAAKLQNRLSVQLLNDAPYWAESFTFYIKETSNEYYNLAMDRWYDAEDGGIWLSFPSSERNKITDTTNLILKKQHDTNRFADFENKYKVLAISNDAPTFIKTENKYWGSLPMMLPPPGWGQLGGWDSGMFYNSGLPLPNRMNLDIYAEYWDQSVFNQLTSLSNAQVRVVQSTGGASAYNAATSDTTNKTKWYDISSITYIGSPPQTQEVTTVDSVTGTETTSLVELPGQQEQLVRISLEKALGDDALFCEPNDALSLARGLSLEARTKIVRDKAQFEGRFFVKILRDSNIEANIVAPQSDLEDNYQVLLSKKIKYICASHPGLQDWSKLAIATVGSSYALQGSSSGTAKAPNFIPIAINYQDGDSDQYGNNSGHQTGTKGGINWDQYGLPNGLLRPRIASSLSATHVNTGASFIDFQGGVREKPDGTGTPGVPPLGGERKWPYGPGDSAVGAFDTNGWGVYPAHSLHLKEDNYTPDAKKSIWPNYRTGTSVTTRGNIPNNGTSFVRVINGLMNMATPLAPPFPSDWDIVYSAADNGGFDLYSSQTYDWPSFGPGVYSPYSRYQSDSGPNDPIASTGIYCANCEQGPFYSPFVNIAHQAIGPYADRVPDAIERSHVLYLSECPALTSGGAEGLAEHQPFVPGFFNMDETNIGLHNYLQGANPLTMPAIWGDQSDFLALNPHYRKQTFSKLSEDWELLYKGRDEIETWPLAKFSPNRWVIDKAGAAQGYSGNGIWDDGNVGYMDISFWGIGSTSSTGLVSRKQNFRETFLQFHQNEIAFANAISTVGTQFRFTHDPDGVIYTITRSVQAEVYNYEAPQGSWAVNTGNVTNPVYEGGSGIGYGSGAPSWSQFESGYLAGGTAFISDLYDKTYNGSLPSNKRMRWTLTLDKIVGTQGDNKFHPLYNHVEPIEKTDGTVVYKSNIEGGRVDYHEGMGGGVVTHEKGGTPNNVSYYNLSSYWNSTQGAGYNAAIGAHQVGLNDIVGGGDASCVYPTGSDTVQPDTIDIADDTNFYNRNPFSYIGLHERGLNQTEIEIVTPYKGEDRDRPMSTNPAVWETEPTEDVGLDIYYAASPSYPISLSRHRDDALKMHDQMDPHTSYFYDYLDRGEEVIKVGSVVDVMFQTNPPAVTDHPTICAVQDDVIWLTESIEGGSSFNSWDTTTKPPTYQSVKLDPGDKIRVTWRGEGTFYGVGLDEEWMEFKIVEALSFTSYRIRRIIHDNPVQLGYYNCWSYGTGVETNRVRDDYNAVTIDKGVKASMPLATPYEEERRGNGLIFSGIYNSTSGINDTNQFIQAEPITKDLNPINGSIQKLYARDTDLVTFCENKVFKILANKDALFNADGNTNVTSNNAVLGQAIPFSGEYGISQNPESFAAESYRLYFTDKDRGAVLRLSKDGITPISNSGMKDWFRDNMRFANNLIGSFDNRDDQYNLTLETLDLQTRSPKAYTVSYTETKRGWESFKSYIIQDGISTKNVYYTFPNNYWIRQSQLDPWDVNYNLNANKLGEMWQHSIDINIDFHITNVVDSSNVLQIPLEFCDVLKVGMYIEGNGIPIDTFITSIANDCSQIEISEPVWLNQYTILKASTPRNTFYNNTLHYSMVTTLFNGDKGTVKRFKTLDYEGSQARVVPQRKDQSVADYKIYPNPTSDDIIGTNNYATQSPTTEVITGQIHYDNRAKRGWYVENLSTDMQEGKIPEFLNKENKWFNNIIGYDTIEVEDKVDTAEFSLQGLGFYGGGDGGGGGDDKPPTDGDGNGDENGDDSTDDSDGRRISYNDNNNGGNTDSGSEGNRIY